MYTPVLHDKDEIHLPSEIALGVHVLCPNKEGKAKLTGIPTKPALHVVMMGFVWEGEFQVALVS